ncbi:MAG TPA: hypothetical protein ENH56_17315 [Roseobacter sp.]|nr:hypothetical protein [Roseobacter sp.]
MKPYRHGGFQNSGEKIREKFAKADRLEAGGFDPLGGKSILHDKHSITHMLFPPYTGFVKRLINIVVKVLG